MRVLTVGLCAILAGCSVLADDLAPPPKYVPPAAPSLAAQTSGILKAAKDELLMNAIQISDMRMVDNGPGRYMICIAGRRQAGEIGYYAAFFENGDYKGVRLAVIYDFCEKQSYRPLD
jgi:hypothetical protein